MSTSDIPLIFENPRAQEARGWVDARLNVKTLTDDERYLLMRIAKFPFERFPDETVPWHLLQWPYQRWEYVRRLVDLIESFKHVKGSYAGGPIELEPFQILILVCFFGPFDLDTGARLVRTMLLTLARKQAKSTLIAAAITAAMAIRPDKGGYFRQELYVGASDREQAGEIYEICSGFILIDQVLGIGEKFKCVPSAKTIQHKSSLTKLKVLSSDAYRAHGRNAVAVIYDEIGNVPTTAAKEFYSVLASGFGAQDEGLVALLSTQAASDIHLFSEMVDKCKGVNSKRIDVDYDLAGFVFEVPDRIDNDEIDPFDERYWYLANPGLLSGPNGMRRTLLPDLRKQAKEAQDLPSLEAEFRNRRLNQRANLRSPVVSASLWKGCSDPSLSLDDPGLRGKQCWIGLDLSSTRDLTAAVIVFEEMESLGGVRPVFAQFWMPSHGLAARARQDKVPYPTWAEQGLVNVEAEKVVDYRYVAQWLAEQTRRFELVGIGYDKWRAEDFKVAAKEESALADYVESDEVFVEIYQSAKYVEPCIEAVENALLLRQIAHSNPVLTWCASNAVSIKNPDGHRKWDKAKSYGRIDGIVALGMALRCREVQAILFGDTEAAAEDDDFAM